MKKREFDMQNNTEIIQPKVKNFSTFPIFDFIWLVTS